VADPKYQIVLAPEAEEDLGSALDYLEEQAPEKCSEWLSSLRRNLDTLKVHPERCPLAPENGLWGTELLHQLLFDRYPSKYRVIFTIDEDSTEVRILNIRHGARRYIHEDDSE